MPLESRCTIPAWELLHAGAQIYPCNILDTAWLQCRMPACKTKHQCLHGTLVRFIRIFAACYNTCHSTYSYLCLSTADCNCTPLATIINISTASTLVQTVHARPYTATQLSRF